MALEVSAILAQLLDKMIKLCALFSNAGCHEPKSVAKQAGLLSPAFTLDTVITVELAYDANRFVATKSYGTP